MSIEEDVPVSIAPRSAELDRPGADQEALVRSDPARCQVGDVGRRNVRSTAFRGSGRSDLPDRLLGFVVVHDDVGSVDRVHRREIELL